MRIFTLWVSVACISLSFILSACHTGKETYKPKATTTAYKKGHPEFIKDMTIGGNKKSSNISMNVVNKHHHKKESRKAQERAGSNPVAQVLVKSDEPLVRIQPQDAGSLTSKYSAMLGVMPTLITNFSLYRFIDDWYGVNYRLGGNDKTGIDCSAFVQRLYEQVFGMTLLRTAIEQFKNCDMTRNVDKLKEGDLVFFHIHSKHITHVGIYLMNRFFVHASASQGVVISSLDDDYWHRYFAGAGKIRS